MDSNAVQSLGGGSSPNSTTDTTITLDAEEGIAESQATGAAEPELDLGPNSNASVDTDSDSDESDQEDARPERPIYSTALNGAQNWNKLSTLWTISAAKKNTSFAESPTESAAHSCSQLYHTKRKSLKLKNYHNNARAMKDIEKFLAQPIVLFKNKMHRTQWEEIVEEMIIKLSKEKPELNLAIKMAMKSVISKEADYLIPESVQGITHSPYGPITEQSFIVVIGETKAVTDSQVVMCVLEQPFNFGNGAEEVRFICLVFSPKKTKHTKSGVEVARTYATLLSDDRLRHNLLNTNSSERFAHEFEMECHRMQKEHQKRERVAAAKISKENETIPKKKHGIPVVGLLQDIKRRSKHYVHDYIGDLKDCTSIQKIISTTLFLFFSLLLPSIAFGVLDAHYTDGKIDVQNVIVSQALGGLLWAVFSGQHLAVIRTTIPVVIYTKIIYLISKNWAEDGSFFYTFYAMVGLTNAVFLVIYGISGVSKVMAYCSRSTEEIFGLFISIAFIVDSVKYIVKEFDLYYYSCELSVNATMGVVKRAGDIAEAADCDQTKPILSLLLVLVTVYVGVVIFNFKYSPFLNADKRLIVADYALVVAVAAGTVLGSYVFRHIELDQFHVNEDRPLFKVVTFESPSAGAVLSAIGLGFLMSILFFMEVNIAASVVNNPANKLKKGRAYHQDMVVIGLINAIMSIFGLPFVHGSLPHSPLHVRALADIEEHIDNGNLTEKIVYVRETRLTTLISNIMIGACVLMIPFPLNLIPIPVLYGQFVFLAVTSLGEFQLWERLVLIFTEQSLYPPIHYVRKVPQKIIHCFTFLQIVQLVGLCLISFAGSAYLKMFFPFAIILLMPIREKVLPALISERHLHWLDGQH